jgi:hypothetical protein
MGACTICGQGAGLFSNLHPQCQAARVTALKSIRASVRDALVGEESALLRLGLPEDDRAVSESLDKALKRPPLARVSGFWDRHADLMNQGHLSRGLALCGDAVIDGWLDAAEAFLSTGIATKFGVTDAVPAAMKAGDKEFGLGASEERLTEARTLLRLSRIRQQIMTREPIEKVPFDVMPARGEGIFWTFNPSTYRRPVK